MGGGVSKRESKANERKAASQILVQSKSTQFPHAVNGRVPDGPIGIMEDHDHHKHGSSVSHSTKRVFNVFRQTPEISTVSSDFFIGFLERSGLIRGDPRLASLFGYLNHLGAATSNVQLNLEQFDRAITDCRTLVTKCVHGELRVASFESEFKAPIEKIFEEVKREAPDGDNAQYIPQLARVDSNLFGMSITTIDGQQFSLGDANVPFCLQSCTKPITYIMALEQQTENVVLKHVGTEASGRCFNEMVLKDAPVEGRPSRQIPHNPMINAGAIMCSSLVRPGLPVRQRLQHIIDVWQKLSAPCEEGQIHCDEETYNSENCTADRNRCLAYMMKEKHSYPHSHFDYNSNDSLESNLELYFRTCSLTSTAKLASTMAASLANGGVNPFTGKRVVSSLNVRRALPIMFSCGMYDYSGQWAYDVGLPAKSGVAGLVFLVIPNICGISIFHPRLGPEGNSTKAVSVAKKLVDHFRFHTFEVFSGVAVDKVDPTMNKEEAYFHFITDVMYCAQEGDVNELANIYQSNPDIWICDYDLRTPLHVAAAEGHKGVVRFIVRHCPEDRRNELLAPVDRWGFTPLDGTKEGSECARILENEGMTRSKKKPVTMPDDPSANLSDDHHTSSLMSPEAPRLLFEAANGEVDEMVKMSSQGIRMDIMDYDKRTALHLAASENHIAALKYILTQLKPGPERDAAIAAQDRFGNTAYDDAVREGNKTIATYLKEFVAWTKECNKKADELKEIHPVEEEPDSPQTPKFQRRLSHQNSSMGLGCGSSRELKTSQFSAAPAKHFGGGGAAYVVRDDEDVM